MKNVRCLRWAFTLVLSLLASTAFGQNIEVSGVVVEANGDAIMGATVVVVGQPSNGASTNPEGRFTLRSVPRDGKIRVSFVGMEPQEIALAGKSFPLRIVLRPSSQLLDELVVVGYGAQKKVNLTGAVSSVNVEDAMGSRPVADVGRGLQGTIPGLNIVVPTGEVGSSPIMKIRGQVASMSGSAAPLILVDNVEVPDITMINPNDIESISVLKDAASASIYGAKAAFGVILITTKQGAKGNTSSISYNSNFSFQSPLKPIEIAGIEGLQYTLDAHRNMGGKGPAGGFWRVDEKSLQKAREWQEKYAGVVGDNDPVVYGRDWWWDGVQKFGYRLYDPVKAMVRDNAFSHQHNLSMNGTRGDTNYNISLGFVDQQGMMKPAKHDDYKRYSFRVNVSTKLHDRVTVRGGVLFSNSTKRYPNAAYGFSSDQWLYLYRWSRLFPIAVQEGGENIRDPYYDTKATNTVYANKQFTNINAGSTIDFTKDWNLVMDYSYSSNLARTKSSMPTFGARYHWYGVEPLKDENGDQVFVDSIDDETGEIIQIPAYRFPWTEYKGIKDTYVYQSSSLSQKHTFNIYSTYNLDLLDEHRFRFMLGANLVADEWNTHSSRRDELLNETNPQFNFAVGKEYAGGSANWSSQLGYFGRLNYSYHDKYLLEANLRYDGTSKFPTALQWRWFPSVSGGWVISQESFMEPLRPVLSFAKLRASWGVIGDQSVSNSLYIPVMTIDKNSWLNNAGEQFFQLSTPQPVSGDITWQDIETVNFGLDMRFFRNKFGVVFEYYHRDTRNMIIPGESLPGTYGATPPRGNYGDLKTKGWELALDFNHRFDNGLGINAMANIFDAVTDITKAADWQTPWENRKIDNIWVTGKRYGDVYGYVTDRLYQKEDFVYDAEGNHVQTTIIWEGNAKRTNMLVGENPVYQTYFEDGGQILLMSPGDVKFVDVDGDGYITPGKSTFGDPGDRVVVGNFTPRYEYGVRLGLDWKGIDFSIFGQGVGKRKIWGSGQLAIPGYFAKEGAMPLTFAKDYWREDRTDAFYPRAWNLSGSNQGYVMRTQSRYMLNMAYFKIKNITLGYTLPKAVLNRVHLSNARFYVTLSDFFTFDKLRGLPIDPEVISGVSMLRSDGNYNLGRTGTQNPTFKSASFGVQITL